MKSRAFILFAVLALVFGVPGRALRTPLGTGPDPVAAAGPASAVDESQVPHYFGPYPNWANSPFTLPDATVAIVGDGSGAAADATVGANGEVTGLTLTNPGAGYSSASVEITGTNGTGAAATATVAASGAVTAVTVESPGSGYVNPTVSFAGGGGTGALVSVGNPLMARTYATDYAEPPGTLAPVLVVLPSSMPAAGVVQSIQYFNQATAGSSPTPSAGNVFHAYVLTATGNPDEFTVAWDSGLLTVPATPDPVGEIVTIPVPDVAVTTGDTIAFYGEGIPLDDAGSGSDVLAYPAPTAPSGTFALNSAEYPIYSQTRTYSIAATVLDSSGVVPLTAATATAYGSVHAISVDSPGSGYTFPTVDIDFPDGPDGVQATAHADFDATTGEITGIVVDNPGAGYSAAPGVVIRDGTLADPVIGGSGATASATLAVASIMVVSPGDGYVEPPSVTIDDPNGTGAVATAVVNAGAVTALDLTASGSGYVTSGGIQKFTDDLPGLCMPPACPTTGKYIPLAVPEAKVYDGIEADEYVIGLVQYKTSFSSSLPDTLVRGYVQLETSANAAISQHVALTNTLLDGTEMPIMQADGVTPWYGVTSPQWLGPTIAATKNRPVRIVFHNLLPTGEDGDLFLPTDSSLMGSGMGPMAMGEPTDDASVMDGVRNPLCSLYPKSDMCFKDNRATLHLHGGITPWISDGTPHQWITPANEDTPWPQGVSVGNVPDMDLCTADDDGCQTFYYTNQQSARLMFYHDHAWGITRLNVYAGEAAGYIIGDETEQALIDSGTIPAAADTIPLIVQDRTFVPDIVQLAQQDPTWDTDRWGGMGSFWYHHVYMPAQNPGDPSGMSAFGRWMYGPWFWPPATPQFGPIPNPYYNMDPKADPPFSEPLDVPCDLDDPSTWQYDTDPFCEPELIPGTPNVSVGMEQFNDTPIVNGVAYPTVTLEPKSYRLRFLNAANDRFFNLQWYTGDPTTLSTALNQHGDPIGATEVALDPAELAAAQTDPVVFPTPVDAGNNAAGPDWIQIGSEGGFLPAPTVIDGQQPTTWITDPTRFDVGNVDQHSLLLAPAERADTIVDFSKFAGQTLILYNDAPAAFPARVPSYDYYTGAPDLRPVGANSPLPGYGPNTRTVMQVKIADTAPAPAFNLTKLRNAFSHKADGSGVFESGQHPIIVGQAAYNSAYGTNFATSSNCNAPNSTLQRCDGLVRVADHTSFGFNTLKSPNTKTTMQVEPKAIHDEMNSVTFDEFGRMSANLGLENQPPTPATQNVTLFPYVNPSTELIDATNLPRADVVYDESGQAVGDVKISPIGSASDGSQLWRVTHNGVDTHPIHFHLYDVQVINRVTWDNIILPPDANELGWKDTVRISPLEDTIVALRPIIPELPWELPNSIRPLNPMMPLGSTAMFNSVDAQGNPTAPIVNQLVNFAWEYVYHCHILSHEEMDMMRPVSVVLPPRKATELAWTTSGNGGNTRLTLTWKDNSVAETSYLVQRRAGTGAWSTIGTIQVPLDQPNTAGDTRSFTDTSFRWNSTVYSYRVVARNTAGYGGEHMALSADSLSAAVSIVAAPTGLRAALQPAPAVSLTWTDNSTTESGFVVERSTDGGATFVQIGTAPARIGTGNVTFVDSAVLLGETFAYRVKAVSGSFESAYSAPLTVVVAAPPAPVSLTAVAGPDQGGQRRVTLSWADVAGETGYTIQRATNDTFTAGLATANVGANATSYVASGLSRGTAYYFRILATNGLVSAWVQATPFPVTTNP